MTEFSFLGVNYRFKWAKLLKNPAYITREKSVLSMEDKWSYDT